ncbi:VWA domain-containing protein [Lentisphaerota bacterium ZTH]|nr:VWA domain-containing protein [Lentisphaerota bacterium]WET05986.1 VWA domain-containing protein [Lentisphaerota bacterium ZTH]
MGLNNYMPLIWLLLLLPLLLAFRNGLVNRPTWLRRGAFLLRCAGISMIILAMCRPFFGQHSNARHYAFLIDVSDSVSLHSAGNSLKKIKQAVSRLDSGDSWEVFYFASSLKKTTPDKLKKKLKKLKNGKGGRLFRRDTALPDAIRAAALTFPAGKEKKMVIFSDGISTKPGLEAALKGFELQGGKIYLEPEGGIDAREVAIIDFKSSGNATYPGETARFEITAMANRKLRAEIRLLNRSVLIKSSPVQLDPNQPRKIIFEVPVIKENSAVWKAEIVAPKDHFPENNVSSCMLQVIGQPKVLALHLKPAKLAGFRRAMHNQGINIETRGRYGFPGSIQELLEFNVVLLADLPADALTTKQMRMLRSYVRDFGCGLIMTGSENSFGLGGYYKTPVEEVMPSVSRYEKEKEQPSIAMVLVIDKSGSMGGLPITLARQASKAAVDLLGRRDRIGIVAFDGQAYTVAKLTPAAEKMAIKSRIDRINSGGGTNLFPAIVTAGNLLQKADTRLRHIIILSDGQSRPGAFEEEAERLAQNGITISTVALGNGAHRLLMRKLAQIGKGRCYEAATPHSMPRIFARETVKASKTAVREEPFCAIKMHSAPFLDGIDFDKAPYLLGFVMTRTKPSAKTLLLCEDGSPLLTFGQFGLGKSCCFTSGITAEWAGEWLEWNSFPRFWAQILRAVIPTPENSNIRTKTVKQGELTCINLTYTDDRGMPLPSVKWDARLTGQGGSVLPPVKITESGYGKYSFTTRLPPDFTGSLMLRDPVSGQNKTVNFVMNYPPEYRLATRKPKILTKLGKLEDALLQQGGAASSRDAAALMAVSGLLMLLGGILLRRI